MIVLHVLSGFHAGGIVQLVLQLLSHASPDQELLLLNTDRDRRHKEFRPAFEALVAQGRLSLTECPSHAGFRLAC